MFLCTFIGIYQDIHGSTYHVERHSIRLTYYIVEQETGETMVFDSLPKSWTKL